MSFRVHMIKKICQLVEIYYQLDRNSSTYLGNLQKDWAFFYPNPNKVYKISNIKWTHLIWLLVGDRPIYLTGDCFCNQNLFFYRSKQLQLGQKPHTSHFFAPFCWEIIRVIYAILAITIENLELRINNPHLPRRKSAVCFEPSPQKDSDGKNYIFTTTSCFSLFKSGKPWTFLIITVYKYWHINW